jgi:Flp pilus assembly protein TadG
MTKNNQLRRVLRRARRGASAVEFAIVAPIFVLFVFGMIEYGRMVMVQQVLTNATREGARLAVLDGATRDEILDAVVDYCSSSRVGIDTSNVTLTPNDPDTAEFGDPVTVSIGVPFSDVSWLPSPMYLGATQLNATSVMRKESGQ